MERVILGKRYNTDKAARLITWDSREFTYSETLCIKRTGELFLHKTGDAYSCMASIDHRSGRIVESEDVMPVDDAWARHWLLTRFESELDLVDHDNAEILLKLAKGVR